MLKNKKAIYLLIPLNLLIWGFFAYRIFAAFNETEAVAEHVVTTQGKTRITIEAGTYKLELGYKDPFLKDLKRDEYGDQQNQIPNEKPQIKNVVKTKQPTAEPKLLPEIKYMGLIKNTTTGSTTALVSVNGQSRLIKQNESIDGIVFKSFNKDSLVAKWGRERIVARK